MPSPVEVAPIEADEAHVWVVLLDSSESRYAASRTLLAIDERRRAEQFQLDAPRMRFAIARAALRVLLGRYLDVTPADVGLTVDRFGKPRLDALQHEADLRFNLAHSGNRAVIAVTRSCEIGVDVEERRSVRHADHIARRYFHTIEMQSILAALPRDRDATFLRFWTAKEAVLKAAGTGIIGSLAAFHVPFGTVEGGQVELPNRADDAARFWVQQIDIGAEYVAAVAIAGTRRRIRLFDFHWDD
jgi:4'-phosphopantetheinyl transferase